MSIDSTDFAPSGDQQPSDDSGPRTAAVMPAAGRGRTARPGRPQGAARAGRRPRCSSTRCARLARVPRRRTGGGGGPADGAAEVRSLLDEHGCPSVPSRGRTRRGDPAGVGRLGLAALPDGVDVGAGARRGPRRWCRSETVDAVARRRAGGRARRRARRCRVADTVKEVEPGPGTASRSRSPARSTAARCGPCRPRRASTRHGARRAHADGGRRRRRHRRRGHGRAARRRRSWSCPATRRRSR